VPLMIIGKTTLKAKLTFVRPVVLLLKTRARVGQGVTIASNIQDIKMVTPVESAVRCSKVDTEALITALDATHGMPMTSV